MTTSTPEKTSPRRAARPRDLSCARTFCPARRKSFTARRGDGYYMAWELRPFFEGFVFWGKQKGCGKQNKHQKHPADPKTPKPSKTPKQALKTPYPNKKDGCCKWRGSCSFVFSGFPIQSIVLVCNSAAPCRPFLGPPARCPFSPLFCGGVPLQKLTTEKSWCPYSKLSTGGPSFDLSVSQGFVLEIGPTLVFNSPDYSAQLGAFEGTLFRGKHKF